METETHVNKTTEKGKEAVGNLKVLAVFAARVKAYSGKGTVTAVVQGENGARLYGVTNLSNSGLLAEAYGGRFIPAETLGSLLRVGVVIGKSACQKWLADNKITGIVADDILGDAKVRSAAGARGSIAVF